MISLVVTEAYMFVGKCNTIEKKKASMLYSFLLLLLQLLKYSV